MLSFELKAGATGAAQLEGRVQLAVIAPSLGSVETLFTRPAITSHAGLSAQDRQRTGINDGLIRIAIGIEATDDLLADFSQALDSLEG